MASNVIHLVMAHRDAQPTFDRHKHLWEKNGYPIIVICPEDNPVSTNHALIKIGSRQHHGKQAVDRFVKVINIGVEAGYPFILFDEYDSFCLEIPIKLMSMKGVHGFVWRDGDPKNGYKGNYFIHPPLLIDLESAVQIVQASETLRHMGDEKGFWDRWLGMVCEKQGIPMNTTEKFHFTRNTIEQGHFGLLAESLKSGAKWFHGVKSKEAYNMIMGSHA